MKVIARGRQGGKTHELIKLAAEEFLYIVCPTLDQVRWVAAKARELGLDIPYPITWDEFASRRYYGKGINGFVIDNLELCAQSMTTVPIRAVSLTDTEAGVPA